MRAGDLITLRDRQSSVVRGTRDSKEWATRGNYLDVPSCTIGIVIERHKEDDAFRVLTAFGPAWFMACWCWK